MKSVQIIVAVGIIAALTACKSDEGKAPSVNTNAQNDCEAEATLLNTETGIEFVRTPESCFENLPDWPYAPKYVEIDGLRQAYIDEGPTNGPVVLLLHGQPSWSYLYRKMIPVLAEAGMRAIAMDHLGMGRSDKPVDITSYSYLGHYDRLIAFIEKLGLRDIHLFVQDWGSLIGLRAVGLRPEFFAKVGVGNGRLVAIPEWAQAYPEVENPNEVLDIPSLFASVPAQQERFSESCEAPGTPQSGNFAVWMEYAMKARSFKPSEVLEALTWFDLPDEEAAAYDAPFPTRTYMAGPRSFPSLVNELSGVNDEALTGLHAFEKPLITVWGGNDNGGLGQCATQDDLIINVPGAAGESHTRLMEAGHFLQDDQGPAIAQRLARFFIGNTSPVKRGGRYCEVLIYKFGEDGVRAEVYGSFGLHDCPAAEFNALDTETIRVENNADFVRLNGPRAWLPNGGWMKRFGQEDIDIVEKQFGNLTMHRIAQFHFPNGLPGSTLYNPISVIRSTTFIFKAGEEIYELRDPEENLYMMQSLNQADDPTALADADLTNLGNRLSLPEGWTFTARVLDAPFVVRAEGTVTIIQDDFGNTYQRVAQEHSGTPQSLPVLEDGTGLHCTTDEDCQQQGAAHCISAGSVNFCTVEGCLPGECGSPYLCCHSCNEALASLLPFEGSACLPAQAKAQLEGAPGCTCD